MHVVLALIVSILVAPKFAFSASFFTRDLSSLISIGDLPDPRVSQRIRDTLSRAQVSSWPVPASTLMTPTAFGAQWTDVFFGGGVETRSRFGSLPHATLHAGFGIGQAETLGLEVAFSSYGVLRRGPPFTTGGVSLKLHRFFPDLSLGFAVGYDNAIVWSTPDSGQSYFAVVSKYWQLRERADKALSLVVLHLGVGDGRYRREEDVRFGRNALSAFGAIAVRWFDPLMMVMNWNGSDLSAGFSVTPFAHFPMAATLAFQDIAGTAGDGVRPALLFSFGDSVQNADFPVPWFRATSR